MEHRSINQLSKSTSIFTAEQVSGSRPLSHRERLQRFAALIENCESTIRPLEGIEFRPVAEAVEMRNDESPLTIAYHDPVLRAEGLCGDRLGDALEFFNLNHAEAHYLLCACHYRGGMTGMLVAQRARAIAHKKKWLEPWQNARQKLTKLFV